MTSTSSTSNGSDKSSSLSATQRRMINALRDGEYHSYLDLARYLDEFQGLGTDFEELFKDQEISTRVKQQIQSNAVGIRRALDPGEVMICEVVGYSKGYRIGWHRSYKIIHPAAQANNIAQIDSSL